MGKHLGCTLIEHMADRNADQRRWQGQRPDNQREMTRKLSPVTMAHIDQRQDDGQRQHGVGQGDRSQQSLEGLLSYPAPTSRYIPGQVPVQKGQSLAEHNQLADKARCGRQSQPYARKGREAGANGHQAVAATIDDFRHAAAAKIGAALRHLLRGIRKDHKKCRDRHAQCPGPIFGRDKSAGDETADSDGHDNAGQHTEARDKGYEFTGVLILLRQHNDLLNPKGDQNRDQRHRLNEQIQDADLGRIEKPHDNRQACGVNHLRGDVPGALKLDVFQIGVIQL